MPEAAMHESHAWRKRRAIARLLLLYAIHRYESDATWEILTLDTVNIVRGPLLSLSHTVQRRICASLVHHNPSGCQCLRRFAGSVRTVGILSSHSCIDEELDSCCRISGPLPGSGVCYLRKAPLRPSFPVQKRQLTRPRYLISRRAL